MMSYDKTGPWNPSNPGQHAPFQMTQSDFNYFHTTRGIPAEKIFLGLPFYGYGFGTGAPESMSYKDIIAGYPNSTHTDEVKLSTGGTIYYNRISTIQQKVNFALQSKAGGVMIWQLPGDSKGANSLLSAIQQTIQK